jgi:hypothetical protein
VTVSGSIPVGSLPTGLTTGTHQVLVRGKDGASWGALVSATFQVDKTGPTVTALAPASAFANGSAPLAFTGTAKDVGGGVPTSATWRVDGVNPPVLATVSAGSGSSATVSGSLTAAQIQALSDGVHRISVVARDDLGTDGPEGPAAVSPAILPGATFTVDKAAPTVQAVTVTPSPNNGAQGVAYDPTSIEVRATVSDPGGAIASGVASGEGFMGSAPAFPAGNGTGFTMVTNTSGGQLTIVATIPLSQLTSLPDGTTKIFVHAKDAAGNWGTAVSGDLVLNRAITVTGLTLTPAATATATTVALAATATAGAGQTVSGAEYYVDTDPGPGAATPATLGPPAQTSPISATINVAGLTVGTHTIGVRVRSSASSTWGPAVTTTLTLNSLFKDGFEAGTLPAPWFGVSTASGGTATVTAGAALGAGSAYGLRVFATGNNSRGYVTTPAIPGGVPSYKARFLLNPSTLITGTRWVTVFAARSGTGNNATERFRVEYQRTSAAATPQVRVFVSANNGNNASNTSAPVNLPGATNLVTVDWVSANAATVVLKATSGATTNTATLTNRNTSNRTVAAARLGISAVSNNGSGSQNGVIFLDAFDSARYAF